MGDVLNRGTKDRPRWYCRFVDLDGKRRQRATNAATKAEARHFLEQIEERVAAGLVGCPRQADRDELKQRMAAELEQRALRQTVTLRQLAARFLGDVEGDPGYMPPRIKNLSRYRRDARACLNARILPAIGDLPAAEITPAAVESMRDRLAKRLKPASVQQTLAILSKVFNWGRRVGALHCGNPAQGVERPRSEHTIDFLSRDEVRRLLDKARALATVEGCHNDRVRFPMVATAIYCGLRKGELAGLRWCDVVLDAGRLTVARSYRDLPKSGHVRHVPMHPELVAILREWQRVCPDVEGLVLPVENSGGALRMCHANDRVGLGELLAAAACHAPIDGKPWHLLRHTFASHFMMAGGSLYALQKLLGHSTPTVTMRYSHLSPDFMRAEVARLSFAEEAPAAVIPFPSARHAAG